MRPFRAAESHPKIARPFGAAEVECRLGHVGQVARAQQLGPGLIRWQLGGEATHARLRTGRVHGRRGMQVRIQLRVAALTQVRIDRGWRLSVRRARPRRALRAARRRRRGAAGREEGDVLDVAHRRGARVRCPQAPGVGAHGERTEAALFHGHALLALQLAARAVRLPDIADV